MTKNKTNKNRSAAASEATPLQLATGSGGGVGGTGPGGNGGAGGSSKGGGAGGSAGTDLGAAGTLQQGGNGGGGSLAGQGGAVGATYPTGGTITASIRGKTGSAGNNGGTFGGGGGGGGTGVVANSQLLIEAPFLGAPPIIQGGQGDVGGKGSDGTAGSGGGGAGLVFTGPGTVTIDSGCEVQGGSSTTYIDGAAGGGGAGLYFQGGASNTTNILDISGDIEGGASIVGEEDSDYGGSGGAGVVLTDNVVLTINNPGTIHGGNTYAEAVSTGPGGAGVLILGDNNTVDNVSGEITGGSSQQAPLAAGVRVVGNNNKIVTASAILSGLLGVDAYGGAIEFAGDNNSLELRNGYSFSGNVVCSGSGSTLALGGDSSFGTGTFDLSSIGSTALFQGFGQYQKTGDGTWVVTGVIGDGGSWIVQDGTLQMSNATITGTVTVNGASTLSINTGTGPSTINRTVSLNDQGALTVADNLFINSHLNFASASNRLSFDFALADELMIQALLGVNLNGVTVDVTNFGGPSGIYTLMQSNGGSIWGNFTSGTLPPGFKLQVVSRFQLQLAAI